MIVVNQQYTNAGLRDSKGCRGGEVRHVRLEVASLGLFVQLHEDRYESGARVKNMLPHEARELARQLVEQAEVVEHSSS